MEISLREWLVIGGVVVIALIIFDGWRRVRGGRNSLRMDIDRKARELPDDDVVAPSNNPELPYGGARPVGAQTQAQDYVPPPRSQATVAPQAAPKAKSHSPAPTRIEPTFGEEGVASRPRAVEPVAPAAEPAVAQAASTQPPMPQRRSEPEPSRSEPVQNIPTEPAFSRRPVAGSQPADPLFDEPLLDEPLLDEPSDDDYPPRGFARAERSAEMPPRTEAAEAATSPPRPESLGVGQTDPLFDDLPPGPSLDLEKPVPLLMERNRQPRRQATPAPAATSAGFAVPGPANPPAPRAESEPPQQSQKASGTSAQKTAQKPSQKAAAEAEQQDLLFAAAPAEPAQPSSGASQPDPEHVLVITVVSTVDEGFPGALLYKIISACDLHFGDMDIFHRHEEGSDSGPVQFSMANAVNPGTFDLATIGQLSTPAVTFFMSMDEPQDVMNAFECMLATAETVARHLDGDLLDENHSVLRPQTKEHYRQRIRDFEMHNRSRRGGGSRD
jgi:cell division protein ZipA